MWLTRSITEETRARARGRRGASPAGRDAPYARLARGEEGGDDDEDDGVHDLDDDDDDSVEADSAETLVDLLQHKVKDLADAESMLELQYQNDLAAGRAGPSNHKLQLLRRITKKHDKKEASLQEEKHTYQQKLEDARAAPECWVMSAIAVADRELRPPNQRKLLVVLRSTLQDDERYLLTCGHSRCYGPASDAPPTPWTGEDGSATLKTRMTCDRCNNADLKRNAKRREIYEGWHREQLEGLVDYKCPKSGRDVRLSLQRTLLCVTARTFTPHQR